MKVDLYKGYNLNRATQYRNEGIQQHSAQDVMPKHAKYPIGYMPHQVSFKERPTHAIVEKLLNVDGLPCIWCGGTMIPKRVKDNLRVKAKTLAEHSKKAMTTISSYEDILKPVEGQVFSEIKSHFAQNPESTLREAMQALRAEHLPRLRSTQHSIMDSIDEEAQFLPEEAKNAVLEFTQNARIRINSDDERKAFRRNPFLFKLKNIFPTDNHPIVDIALKLPTAGDNVDSFVVKYSGQHPPKFFGKGKTKRLEDVVTNDERQILRQIQVRNGNMYPDLSIQEVIDKLYPQSAKVIRANNSNAAQSISEILTAFASKIEGLSSEQKTSFDSLMLNEAKSPGAKRKAVFDEVSKFRQLLSENVFAKLQESADKMPHPSRSTEALVMEDFERALQFLRKNEQNTFAMKNETYVRIATMLKSNKYGNSECSAKTLENNQHLIKANLQYEQQRAMDEIIATLIKYKSELDGNILTLTKDFKTKSLTEQPGFLTKLSEINVPSGIRISISELIDNLPSSKDNMHAFVTKYASITDSPIEEVWLDWTNDEIAQRIIRPSLSSDDHLKSRKAHKDEGKTEEQDRLGNHGIACIGCNGEKDDQEITEFIRSKPIILTKQTPQKQVNVLIKMMNSGPLSDCKHYLLALRPSLESKTRGLIKIDISKLKVSKQKIEEAKKASNPGHLRKRAKRKREEFLAKQKALRLQQKNPPSSIHEAA